MLIKALVRACGLLFGAGLLTVPAYAQQVGTIPGEFSVSESGEANYRIPIFSPEATGGLQPNVSLVYSHRGDMEVAGQGWAISGLSMISRCPQSIAVDGTVGAVTYTATDRFCLDGQRLMGISGTYGAINSAYRKEIDDLSKVVASGTLQGTGPQSFTVTDSKGTKYFYGHSNNSSLKNGAAGTTYRFWALYRVEDLFGNQMNYTYAKDDTLGEFRIDRIDYTARTATPALTAKYRIQFTYEPRPVSDRRAGYTAGVPWTHDDRLEQIMVTYNTTSEIARYDLAYQTDTATGRSQLINVKQCRGTTVCLPQSTFQWSNGVVSWASPQTTGQADTGYATARAGDFDGDGRHDLFVSQSSKLVVLRSTGTAFTKLAMTTGTYTSGETVEFNGDGLTDVIYQGTTGNFHVYRSTGNIGAGQTYFTDFNTGIPYVAGSLYNDLNGDGLDDLLIKTGTKTWKVRYATGTGYGALSASNVLSACGNQFTTPSIYKLTRLDFNNDGRKDMLINCWYDDPEAPNEWWVEAFVATNTGYIDYGTCSQTAKVYTAVPMDINGDGLTDLACVSNQTSVGWFTKLSTGTGLAAETFVDPIPVTEYRKAAAADYDGDGRQDFLYPVSNGWNVYLSTGTTLSSTPILVSGGAGTDDNLVVMDMAGDGYADLIITEGGLWKYRNHQSPYADVVTRFTDGLGSYFQPAYAPTTKLVGSEGGAYVINSPAVSLPTIFHYKGPLYVTKEHVANDGIGGTYTISYQYENALVSRTGRGFLGFREMRTTDPRGGTRVAHQQFRQDFPYIGRLELSTLKNGSGTTLRISDPTWNNQLFGSGSTASRFVYADKVVDSENDLAGTLLRTSEDDPTYTFNTTLRYAEVPSAIQKITEAVTGKVWQTSTTFNQTSYTTPWCIDLPQLVTTTKALPDSSDSVRKLRHVYDSTKCRVTQITDESETSTAKQLRTTFTYDAYGNVDLMSTDSVDTNAQNRSLDFGYGTDGQFPTTVTVGTVNLTTMTDWDYLTGQRASETGPDGLTTSWMYDEFGRIKKETRPGTGRYTDFSFEAVASCGSAENLCWPPKRTKFYMLADNTNGQDSWQYFDELQRPVGDSRRVPGSTGPVFSRYEVRYNAAGQVDRTSQRFLAGHQRFWVTYQYDLLGRVTEEDAPISEALESGATTTYSYMGRDIWVTDAENHLTKYVHNGAGQIEKVINAASSNTLYTYWPFGELKSVTDADSNTTNLDYDARGFKSTLDDPNFSADWEYDYDIYGQLKSQTNPSGQEITMDYREDGQIKTRTDVAESATTTFSYYSTGTGKIGKVDTIAGVGHSEHYGYSSTDGAVIYIERKLDNWPYWFNFNYDDQGRLDAVRYPDISGYRFKVDYDYDWAGNLTAAKDADTLAYFYVRNATDAMGRDTSVTLGNGKDEERIFDRATGYLESIQTGTLPGTPNIQDLSFTYDEVGNLETRTNTVIGKTETLNYDALDRLTSSVVSTGGTTVTVAYSAAGRLDSKTGLGTYTYTGGSCGGGPFAPKNVSGVTYCYDASGRMTSRGADTFTWYSYDLPKKLASATKSAEFSYGVDRERYKQVLKTGTTTDSTIYYVGRLYEKEIAGSTTTYRHHVMVGERMVATVARVGTTNTTQYLHQDHQGSVVEVTSSTGSLVQSLAYDPWGLRRNATNWLPLANAFGGTEPTERGYTGHEHLDTVKYIHMNGRVQDPTLGIFLSPDPIVQSPFNSQSFNRYAYVRNNPATFIDPSGYGLKRFLKRWVGPFFGGGIAEGAGAGLWGGFAGFIAATAVNVILDHHADQSSAHFVQQAPTNNTNAQRHAPTGIGPVVGTGVQSSGASTASGPASSFDRGEQSGNSSAPRERSNAATGGRARSRSINDRISVTTSFDPETGSHMYSIRGTICSQSSSSCNAGLADQVWGAVNRNDVPFSSNDLGSGNKDLLFGFAPIRHTEFDSLRTSVNITRDGHPLHPGDVVHRVHFEEGSLYYDVVGTGSGNLPRTNNQLGVLLFRPGVYSAVREFGR